MSQSSENNKRIAKNTQLLYFRMLLIIVVLCLQAESFYINQEYRIVVFVMLWADMALKGSK